MTENWYEAAMASFGKGPALPGDVHEAAFDNAAATVLEFHVKLPRPPTFNAICQDGRIDIECPMCGAWSPSKTWHLISENQFSCPACEWNFYVVEPS